MYFAKFILTVLIMRNTVRGNDMNDLVKAIKSGDFLEIKRLVEIVDVDRIHPGYQYSVLHVAANFADAEIMRFLMSKGANKVINEVTHSIGCTPLLLCSKRNEEDAYEIMEVLLKAGANATVGNMYGFTPLHYAQQETTTRLLISYGANVDARNILGRIPAYEALCRKDAAVLVALIDGNADLSILDWAGASIFHAYDTNSPFRMRKEIACLLVERGVPLHTLDALGETAMTRFLKLQIRSGSNLSYENLKDSFYACMVAAGEDVNFSNRHGEALIHIAVRKYQLDMVKWLLENGADVESKNSRRDTPLLMWLKFQKREYFLEMELRPHLRFKERIVSRKAMVKLLVDAGANLETVDKNGHNAKYYLEKHNLTLVDS